MAGGGGVPIIRSDLWKHGFVTQVISPTQFLSNDLAGLGDNFFASSGIIVGWGVYVLRDIRSTATLVVPPQGEQTFTISSLNGGYISHLAFTVPLVPGDEILMLHPNISAALYAVGNQIVLLHGSPPVAGSVTANWNAGEQVITTIGAAGVRNKVHSTIVNIIATGGNITLRMYISVNGVPAMIFPPKPVTWNKATDSPGVALINGTFGIANALLITGQSDAPGDNGVAITFEYFVEPM